ncbi:hypothetical protein [Methyloversatilis sp.]|uniref:hypothetical protein n=1 Tax=Methyloversatilis sp. TaxID=2569862 RepID=UPI003D2E031B
MESQDDVLVANRVMLVHFDSYSTALVFAKWNDTLLLPAPLPPSAELMPAPAADAADDGEAVKAAAIARLGLNPAEVVRPGDFNHWVFTADGPVRVHLLRFTTFEAPKAALEPHGGVFRPISALRGGTPVELLLAREVFNLIVGAGGGRA